MFSWFLAPAGAQEVTVSLSVRLDILSILGQVLQYSKTLIFCQAQGQGQVRQCNTGQ